ncbi:MAG: S41 family peptidase [Bryobacteraceae bacterium]|nr:S41 family peptidase [Bryobacteraceae bacterium]
MNRRFNVVFVTVSTVLVGLLLVGSVLGRAANPEDAYKHLAVFTEVLSRIKSDYVEEPDLKGVTAGAINGLLEAIDPYASYLSADQYKQYLKQKDQRRADVGLVLSKRFGYIGVVDAVAGSPAWKAGLNTGDMIESIQGVATRDMPLAYAEMLMKGDAGSTVDLTVLRVRRPEPSKVTLTRANVKLPGIQSKMLPDQVGLIAVQSLETGRAKDAEAAIASLEKQGAKKLVLDLRDCAIGPSEEGVALANLFLDKGLITYLQGQRVMRQNFEAAPAKQATKLPVVVVTNRGTAGGAEIAAAALRDSKRGYTVGERTYGDAAMRKAVTLEDGSAIILAIAKYYSPSGKSIQDNAVSPDVPVADTPEPADTDEDNVPEPGEPKPRSTSDDAVLKKALDVLTNGLPKVAKN